MLEKDRSALEEPIQSFKDMGWEGGRLGGEVFWWILGGLGGCWDVLGGLWGRSWGGLEGILGDLEGILAHLGTSWRHLGGVLKRIGGPKRPKNFARTAQDGSKMPPRQPEIRFSAKKRKK